MANIKSAKKRIRVIETKTAKNKRVKLRLKEILKSFDAAIESGDQEKAREMLSLAEKKLKQAVSKGTLHLNTASRKVSRLTKRFTNEFGIEALNEKPKAKKASKSTTKKVEEKKEDAPKEEKPEEKADESKADEKEAEEKPKKKAAPKKKSTKKESAEEADKADEKKAEDTKADDADKKEEASEEPKTEE